MLSLPHIRSGHQVCTLWGCLCLAGICTGVGFFLIFDRDSPLHPPAQYLCLYHCIFACEPEMDFAIIALQFSVLLCKYQRRIITWLFNSCPLTFFFHPLMPLWAFSTPCIGFGMHRRFTRLFTFPGEKGVWVLVWAYNSFRSKPCFSRLSGLLASSISYHPSFVASDQGSCAKSCRASWCYGCLLVNVWVRGNEARSSVTKLFSLPAPCLAWWSWCWYLLVILIHLLQFVLDTMSFPHWPSYILSVFIRAA